MVSPIMIMPPSEVNLVSSARAGMPSLTHLGSVSEKSKRIIFETSWPFSAVRTVTMQPALLLVKVTLIIRLS